MCKRIDGKRHPTGVGSIWVKLERKYSGKWVENTRLLGLGVFCYNPEFDTCKS